MDINVIVAQLQSNSSKGQGNRFGRNTRYLCFFFVVWEVTDRQWSGWWDKGRWEMTCDICRWARVLKGPVLSLGEAPCCEWVPRPAPDSWGGLVKVS